MMSNSKPITLSIKELLSGESYVIPTYQRNYAWGVDELAQLIQDVADYASENPTGRYYIGTLVVFPRKNDEGAVIYETVDGQQRLTTLNIILCALKNELSIKDLDWYKKVNISFAYRKKSNLTLDVLFTHNDTNQYEDLNEDILEVYQNCDAKISAILNDKKSLSKEQFIDYFLNNVCIVRVCVPEQTDLNHYFEIMNSRGVQLEMHEILKASLLDILNYSENADTDSLLAADIWESCSVMTRYVQMGFNKDRRDILFAKDWNRFGWKSADDLFNCRDLGYQKNESKGYSLKQIISGEADLAGVEEESENTSVVSSYTPIINFPNFLLHVLEIHVNSDIALDDKQLLKEFYRVLPKEREEQVSFVKEFFFKLLKVRYLLDKFVVKREYSRSTEEWAISRLYNYGKSHSYISTFDNAQTQENLIKIQTMFHVSSPAQYRKNWLNGCLKYLFDHYEDNAKEQIDSNDYLNYLECVSRAYVCDRYLCKEENTRPFRDILRDPKNLKNGINNLCFKYLDNGTSVENYLFNYLDYQLWKSDKVKWSRFDFSFRSSIEHFYPQNPIDMDTMEEEPLNSFGNLCLISRSMNSRLSNYSPLAKKDHYMKNRDIESIKQRIMMSLVHKNSDWNVEAIKAHGDSMKAIIANSLTD